MKLTENQYRTGATKRALRSAVIRLAPHASEVALRATLKEHRLALRDRCEEPAEAVAQRVARTMQIEYCDQKTDRTVITLCAPHATGTGRVRGR